MLKEFLDRFENAEKLCVAVRVGSFEACFVVPATYYYNSFTDELSIGDDENGFSLFHFKDKFDVRHDEAYDDYTLISNDEEVCINF